MFMNGVLTKASKDMKYEGFKRSEKCHEHFIGSTLSSNNDYIVIKITVIGTVIEVVYKVECVNFCQKYVSKHFMQNFYLFETPITETNITKYSWKGKNTFQMIFPIAVEARVFRIFNRRSHRPNSKRD